MALLEARDLTVTFGGNRALSGATLHADPRHITGLIGPNGAGKTTMFNIICGLLKPDSGDVLLRGESLLGKNPTRRARLGLARTFQRLELFTMMSVRENVQVAVETQRALRATGATRRRVDELLDRVGLLGRADERVTNLPTGQARLVELARALACDPSVLLLDEPASGQDDTETATFAALLRELAAGGLAVVMVEHDMRLVMEVCDPIHVLDFGRVLAVGSPDEIRTNEAVLAAYLGAQKEAS
ncbi:MAG TPA: ABC transporter ATP-binding protein [Acidimicrobiales bacterium]|jgi:branched-chain amino acid transport system ATP-binding protein|nr:ABC transporter ATP-binding protein [Acidimicrobiales bacterium]